MPNLSKIYDVIVVGAGPAGSLVAYYLAQQDIPVLIVEKRKLPRPKVCGGGLTKRTLDILPFAVDAVVEDLATTATLSVKNHPVFSKTYAYPITALVMRDRFDHFLTRKAVEKGAVLMEETEFIDVTGSPGGLRVETSKGRTKARIIVGADGMHSRVAARLKLPVRRKQMTALEAEVGLKRPNASMKRFRHTVRFDVGPVPGGYGWVFPKKDHLSIGILSVSNKRKGIRNALNAFIRAQQLDNHIERLALRGHGIPYGPDRKNRYAAALGLLVGDATGIVDPITGEGIYYAVRGAQIAADALTACLTDGSRPLHAYDAMLKEALFPDIAHARKLAHILYAWETLSHRALKAHGARITENHVRIITGEKTYGQLCREVCSMAGLRILLGLR